MSDDGFFDDPRKKRSHKLVLGSEDVAQLNELLVACVKDQIPPEQAHAQYVERLQQLLAAQGTTLQTASADNPDFAYIKAATDSEQFGLLMRQAGAASAGAAAAATDAKKSWEPPAADADPEDEADDCA